MKRNKFSLSHYTLATAGYGTLTPLTWYEAIPGDTLQQQTSLLIRATPLVSPVMHPVRVRLHTWFVPNRLIWDEWEDFITGGDDGDFTAIPPYFEEASITAGSFQELMGVPPGTYSPSLQFSALPFRAYANIYNEHYRDQDLVAEIPIGKSSGLDLDTNKEIQRVAWEKDYLTSARPWASKGTEILIPIGDRAPVMGVGWGNNPPVASENSMRQSDGSQSQVRSLDSGDYNLAMAENLQEEGYPDVWTDLSQATGITVNELRNFLALQRYQEARAQFGSRYSEYIKFLVPGIGNLDSRLQEPEYIGGGSSTISFSEVLQTMDDETGGERGPLGKLGGHGISAMRSRRTRKFCPEHGIVMTLLSVVPKAIYSQQLNRKWNRNTKEHYFQKELQFIGEQPVLNKEVYAQHTQPDEQFGFQMRYDDYRYHESSIHGEFHNEQDGWHFARIFEGDTALNKSFIECNPPPRPHADQVGDPLYIMAQHSIQARRILSKWSTPKTF